MNTREFVTKIIKNNRYNIIQKIKMIPKLLSAALISVLGLISLASVPNIVISTYAQNVQEPSPLRTSDPWYQSFEIARSKVEAASSAGAFGNGVPSLHNLSVNEILLTFGITVMGSLLVFMAVRMWRSRMRSGGRQRNILAYR